MYDNYIRRGDIFYIAPADIEEIGSEQRGGRPAIVVSNEACNKYSPVIEVVFLTTKEKKNMPTHVKINSSKYPSTAMCEQITSVDKSRLMNYMSSISVEELREVNEGIIVSLGLASMIRQPEKPNKPTQEEKPVQQNTTRQNEKINCHYS